MAFIEAVASTMVAESGIVYSDGGALKKCCGSVVPMRAVVAVMGAVAATVVSKVGAEVAVMGAGYAILQR